jgi:hypothetical protein
MAHLKLYTVGEPEGWCNAVFESKLKDQTTHDLCTLCSGLSEYLGRPATTELKLSSLDVPDTATFSLTHHHSNLSSTAQMI